MKKLRADQLLYERGLSESVEKAKRDIMAGIVYANEVRIDTPGELVPLDKVVTVKRKRTHYVSRGGYKLEKALTFFEIDVKGKILLDIGASTGGFTDCALQKGATQSYAVDVGTNQLAWKIRSDDRVIAMEKMNFRTATASDFIHGKPTIATIDVSFISLALILPPLTAILMPGGDCICLVKPQFEAERDQVGERGIVRDKETHISVLEEVRSFSLSLGFDFIGATHSPITGGEGNIEFLFHLVWNGENQIGIDSSTDSLEEIVDLAHTELLGTK